MRARGLRRAGQGAVARAMGGPTVPSVDALSADESRSLVSERTVTASQVHHCISFTRWGRGYDDVIIVPGAVITTCSANQNVDSDPGVACGASLVRHGRRRLAPDSEASLRAPFRARPRW